MLSLCITHYNRFEMLKECFAQVIDDPRIDEIVIQDDFSDQECWQQVDEYFGKIPKVKLFRNAANVQVYQNKMRAIRNAAGPWCILFDSDNIIEPKYLDVIYGFGPWDHRTSYLPDFAMPTFDYRLFDDCLIGKNNVSKIMDIAKFDCLINTMNGMYFRSEYLRLWDASGFEPISADSMYLNYLLLKGGNTLYVVPGLEYYHRVHAGSHYKLNSHKSDIIHADLMKKLKAMPYGDSKKHGTEGQLPIPDGDGDRIR